MATQGKVDFKVTEKRLFSAPSDDFVEVDIPGLTYLMIDGQGAPGGAAYIDALGSLYPAAYALKFFSKQTLEQDYVVPPLEGLWWSDKKDAFTAGRQDEWRWTMMIMVPDWITPDQFAAVLEALKAKKPEIDFSKLRMASLHEGRSLQKLHLGSFADEAPVLHRLHYELMPSLGLTFNGPHHEIYLSDPRKVAPEKLRTVLRQPVRSV
ncbi:GyrI-like domain-containing protein [Novosphingobium beihaiensis]|uniref:GyrI-like domain-containing protein n=1 Tax=Novosphingobium beihaiensis TaxID=2930389 RepID=A0ABT0BQN8_9SPHN|nr:GyrI-like domain-containing protein [Novosphingobium beihaiensis]MCJ2187361.1 GyrI-like domain-containing protein [Novosphingobium beihaiensis]